MIQDEQGQILRDLGLTLLQAKAYLALSKTGKATVKTIAKASSIARQDIYRVMPALQKLGLTEKIIAKPITYKATSLKEGLSILLRNQTQKHAELQEKTIKMLNNCPKSEDEAAFQEEDQQFSIVSSKPLLLKRFAEKENAVQTSISIVGKWEGIRSMLFYRFQYLKRALKKGVKIRVITEKHEEDKSTQENIQTLTINPLFGIRYLSAPIPVKTVIHDGTEVNMCIAIPPDNDVPSLWSNNPQFVKVMSTYFEEIWNKAVDAPEILRAKA